MILISANYTEHLTSTVVLFFLQHSTVCNVFFFKLENQQKRNFSEASELREKMKSLWGKLEIDESERQAFLSRNEGYKPSVICKVRFTVIKYFLTKSRTVTEF